MVFAGPKDCSLFLCNSRQFVCQSSGYFLNVIDAKMHNIFEGTVTVKYRVRLDCDSFRFRVPVDSWWHVLHKYLCTCVPYHALSKDFRLFSLSCDLPSVE